MVGIVRATGVLFVCAAFFTTMLVASPIRTMFEFDRDEGINLMKAALLEAGHPLYREVWDDQPPIMTVLLSRLFRVMGHSVLGARLLVLAFSTLLIGCFFEVIRMSVGIVPAITGVALLALSDQYARLSVSVMVGLPSMALAMLSVWLAFLSARRSPLLFAAFSGAALALSMQTKLSSTFLAPLLLSYVVIAGIKNWRAGRGRAWTGAVVWVMSWVAVFFIIGWVCHSLDYQQLVGVHERKEVVAAAYEPTAKALMRMLASDWQYWWLAFPGLLAAVLSRRWEWLFPATWLGIAYLILRQHTPLWFHHYLLMSVPLSWLAAYGVAGICDLFTRRRDARSMWTGLIARGMVAAGAMAILFLVVRGVPERIDRCRAERMKFVDIKGAPKIVGLLRTRAAKTR